MFQEKGTDVDMSNLDQFMSDLYMDEVLFKIDDSEVAFIQTGVETVVQIIADLVWKNASKSIQNETEAMLQTFPDMRISRNRKYAISDIVKVGSFYEHTKNSSPDQFDFIFLMCIFESDKFVESRRCSTVTYDSGFHAECRDILSSCDITFPSLDEREKYIRFDRYLEQKGPVSKLRFVYGNNKKEIYIYVNVVPAFKVLVPNMNANIVDIYGIPGFVKEIKRTGSFIMIQGHICYPEAELCFMRNVLSSNHVKVYRVLKYLMCGNYNNQFRRKACKSEFWSIFAQTVPRLVTSYQMKRGIIIHHYECRGTDGEDLVPCLLAVLESLKDKMFVDNTIELQGLFTEQRETLNGYKLELLENMITFFRAMQRSSQPRNSHTFKDSHCLADTPLLNEQEEQKGKDSQSDKTTVTCLDWVKLFVPYLSYIILISVGGAFVIILLQILSHRV